MPPHRLSLANGTSKAPSVQLDETVNAVLKALAGTPLHEASAHTCIEPLDLAEAVEVYQQAGRRSLIEQAGAEDWWQLYIQFTEWTTAEKTAADHLAPLLHRAESDGTVTAWWFIRKHPCWRVRLHIPSQGQSVRDAFRTVLDELTAADLIHRWWTGIYEPETAAFGNATGMRIAHELFHADSRAILALQRRGDIPLGRRELSVLLCSTLMRAAALEWYEQGDVWHLVARQRPLPADVPSDVLQELADDLRKLLLADTTPDGPLLGPNRPIAFAADWADAFRRAGRDLGTAARTGTLDRGLRQILAYYVIFHWNRLGLPARNQSILAWAARAAIIG